MSWKSFACVAALCALAVPAAAQPTLSGAGSGGTATLSITPSVESALAVEFDVTATGVTIDDIVIADTSVWDTATPGDNPFIDGSQVGGDSTGIDSSTGDWFVSYGSDVVSTISDLLTISYTGTSGTITIGANADIAAEDGTLYNLGTFDIVIEDGPVLLADFDMSGGVNLVDLNILGTGFGNFEGDAEKINGDADGDGFVDLVDLNILGMEFDPSSPSAAVPEPASAALVLLGLAAVARRRN